MRHSALLLTILLVLVVPEALRGQGALPDSAGTGKVEGTVSGRQRATSYSLPFALLEFSKGREIKTAATDSLGRYGVTGLRPGRWRVHAAHVGHEGLTLDVLVPTEGTLSLDMELLARPIPLEPLEVLVRSLPMADVDSGPRAQDVGEVSLRAMEGSTGMVESGLAQVVRALPGSNQADPTDVLLMRGSAADLKLVLLDGAPVYTPFHLGGLVESFDPGALGAASLFLGGAPAHFDGGLSYIMDLRTRRPSSDRVRVQAAADLMTSRLLLEGPALGGGLMVGSRLIHDLGTPALNRESSPYGYGDVLVRGSWGEDEGPVAFLTGFWNEESVKLELGEITGASGASWGNQALSGGIRGPMGKASGELRGALSRYDARLPVADSIPLFARSRSERVRVTGDLSHPWGTGTLRVGGVLDHLDSRYRAQGLDEDGRPVASALRLDGTTLGVYGEGTRNIRPSLQIRGGLRLDHFSQGGGVRLAPRVAFSWFLTDNANLTLAAGRYHQLATLSSGQLEEDLAENAAPAGEGAESGGASSDLETQFSVGTADHLVVSLDQVLLPGLRLGIEAYMKTFSGVFGSSNPDLNASGVDLRVARDGERTSGWLGYTLTWLWTSREGFLGGNDQFSGRHLLSAGLSTRISQGTGLRLRVGYGDGLPYTSIPVYSPADAPALDDSPEGLRNRFELDGANLLNQAPSLAVAPDRGFLRVEGELYALWNTTLGRKPMEVRPYLRVLNALNRRDALFYHFDPWRSSTPRPLAELPVLPLLGVEVAF